MESTCSVILKVGNSFRTLSLIPKFHSFSLAHSPVYLCAGGLVCRGILEHFSELNVKTFISLSAPQAGQFGS